MRFLIVVVALAGAAGLATLSALHLLAVLWIPLAMLLFLAGFPLVAVVGRNSLFYGLFDLDLSPRNLPIRHFVVTLAAFTVSASAWCILRLMLSAGPDRLGMTPHYGTFLGWIMDIQSPLTACRLLAILGPPLLLAAFFALFALIVSCREGRSLVRVGAGVLAGLVADALCGFWVLYLGRHWLAREEWRTSFHGLLGCVHAGIERLGPGYHKHWADHAFAGMAAILVLVLYAVLGVYGRLRLGKGHTVAALAGPLMAVVVLGWWGAAAEFFLCRWNISLLLLVALFGLINGFIPLSDHTYKMVHRSKTLPLAPFEALTASGRKAAIVVASAGGGIQAAAWTAKVLEELHWQHGPKFDRALSLISSISGGSMGSACYVNWIANDASPELQTPFDAASASSLDEVAWGLAWPDLIRLFLPISCGVMPDRAHAMERAWCGNTLKPGAQLGAQLDDPLSDWNAPVAQAKLPSVLMNSTIVETGGPLLLGTTKVVTRNPAQSRRASSSWMDGDQLHVEDEHGRVQRDIPVVRAARLSATFPYVTPAARPVHAWRQPHMMDGGLYDNYGMASLTEWLDQALEEQARRIPGSPQVEKILVLQINGFPPPDYEIAAPAETRGGWVKQLIAPILALVNVRTAGQVSHRDIELDLLMEKWKCRGIEITSAGFELAKKDAPLSWHLTPSEIDCIKQGWSSPGPSICKARQQVTDFLASV